MDKGSVILQGEAAVIRKMPTRKIVCSTVSLKSEVDCRSSNSPRADCNQISCKQVASTASLVQPVLITETTASLSQKSWILRPRQYWPHKSTATITTRSSRWWIAVQTVATKLGKTDWKYSVHDTPLHRDKHASVAKTASGTDHGEVGMRETPL